MNPSRLKLQKCKRISSMHTILCTLNKRLIIIFSLSSLPPSPSLTFFSFFKHMTSRHKERKQAFASTLIPHRTRKLFCGIPRSRFSAFQYFVNFSVHGIRLLRPSVAYKGCDWSGGCAGRVGVGKRRGSSLDFE